MKIGSDYRIGAADRAEALIRFAGALGLGESATARRFEELAAGLPDALRRTAESLGAIDEARPILADYVIEQTERAQLCEKIAATAVRRAAPQSRMARERRPGVRNRA
ncbi:MAG: type II toxin-antitoxin system HipA family toxin [Acidimicrobiaceae bacterium]|nr:type II toxin-antitoxin system HipA family toxin [Acidimicrobiaceae bacterium]